MSKYLITVSWQDTFQPLMRCKETVTHDIEDIESKAGWEIVQEVKCGFGRSHSDKEIAIDFMMKLD